MTIEIKNAFEHEIQNGFLKAIYVINYMIETCGLKSDKEIENTSLSDLYCEIENEKHFISHTYVDKAEGSFYVEMRKLS